MLLSSWPVLQEEGVTVCLPYHECTIRSAPPLECRSSPWAWECREWEHTTAQWGKKRKVWTEDPTWPERMFSDWPDLCVGYLCFPGPILDQNQGLPYLNLRKLLLGGSELLTNPALGLQLFHCLVGVFGLLLASAGVFPPLAQLLLKLLKQREVVKQQRPLFTAGEAAETTYR